MPARAWRACKYDSRKDWIQGGYLVHESPKEKWVWVDTCCIGKASSTEVSESINSSQQALYPFSFPADAYVLVWAWYKQAETYYVYLADVPRSPRYLLDHRMYKYTCG
ncbi:hypothetical protein LTS10_012373 [Elasticomyces elasticus]|nr:hypothetical protein LTS10_012373 [Elasticomyces elasticus]